MGREIHILYYIQHILVQNVQNAKAPFLFYHFNVLLYSFLIKPLMFYSKYRLLNQGNLLIKFYLHLTVNYVCNYLSVFLAVN